MIDNAKQREFMIRYLFGEVSAKERAEHEDKYLSDGNVFQELITLENELIDRYILDDLPSSDKERFERSYLSHPGRRQTVEIARSLLTHSASTEDAALFDATTGREVRPVLVGKTTTWAMQIAAAVAILIIATGMFSLLVVNRKLGREVERLRAEQTRVAHENDTLQRQVNSLRADLHERDNTLQQLAELQSDQSTISFTLAGESPRTNAEPRELIIPARASAVSLHLIIASSPHSHYNLSIETAAGNLAWRGESIQSRILGTGGQEIVVTLPSHLFHNDDYVIRVATGKDDVFDSVAGFALRVVKR